MDTNAEGIGGADRRLIAKLFHRLYYGDGLTSRAYWFGVRAQKCPLDMWAYQEILHETRPDLLVETGTADGGSALFFAHMFDLLGHGDVVSVDLLSRGQPPQHPRITYVRGTSVGHDVLERVRGLAAGKQTMVVLDSDHSRDHVLAELDAYAPLVSPGCYLVVEDTDVNGHPVHRGHGPGPMEALEGWLPDHPEFEVDRAREKFLLTLFPGGWLRRRGG